MNVPEHIKKAIFECAEAYAKAGMQDEIIRNWMQHNELVDEDFDSTCDLNISDTYIDSVTLTNNPEDFIQLLESMS